MPTTVIRVSRAGGILDKDTPVGNNEDVRWEMDAADSIGDDEKLVAESSKPTDTTLTFRAEGQKKDKKTSDKNIKYITDGGSHKVAYKVFIRDEVKGTESPIGTDYLVIATSGPPTPDYCKDKYHPLQKHADRVRTA